MSRYTQYFWKNNVSSKLAVWISSIATTIQVEAWEWELRWTDFPILWTLEHRDSTWKCTKREIVKVVSKSTDSFTVVRKFAPCPVSDDSTSQSAVSNSFDPWDTFSIYIPYEILNAVSEAITDLYNNWNDRLFLKKTSWLWFEITPWNVRFESWEWYYPWWTWTVVDNSMNYVMLDSSFNIIVNQEELFDVQNISIAEVKAVNGEITEITTRKIDWIAWRMWGWWDPVYWDWSDWDLVISENTILNAWQQYQFHNLTICSWATVSFTWNWWAKIKVANLFINEWIIDTTDLDVDNHSYRDSTSFCEICNCAWNSKIEFWKWWCWWMQCCWWRWWNGWDAIACDTCSCVWAWWTWWATAWNWWKWYNCWWWGWWACCWSWWSAWNWLNWWNWWCNTCESQAFWWGWWWGWFYTWNWGNWGNATYCWSVSCQLCIMWGNWGNWGILWNWWKGWDISWYWTWWTWWAWVCWWQWGNWSRYNLKELWYWWKWWDWYYWGNWWNWAWGYSFNTWQSSYNNIPCRAWNWWKWWAWLVPWQWWQWGSMANQPPYTHGCRCFWTWWDWWDWVSSLHSLNIKAKCFCNTGCILSIWATWWKWWKWWSYCNFSSASYLWSCWYNPWKWWNWWKGWQWWNIQIITDTLLEKWCISVAWWVWWAWWDWWVACYGSCCLVWPNWYQWASWDSWTLYFFMLEW